MSDPNLAERLTKVERDQSHPNLKPRDAATLIVVDRSGPVPKVLLGRRNANTPHGPGPLEAHLAFASQI